MVDAPNILIPDAARDGRVLKTSLKGKTHTPHVISEADTEGLSPVISTEVESGHVLSDVPASLHSIAAFPTVDGFLLLVDATAKPGNGPVVLRHVPVPVYANVGVSMSWPVKPLKFEAGIVALFSTTAGFVFTGSATCIFSAQVSPSE